MNSLIKRTVVLFPIALVALSGAAFAATSGGGGGGGGGGAGGGGEGSGGAEIPTCLTGAFCPPGKNDLPPIKVDPKSKLADPVAIDPGPGFNPNLPPFNPNLPKVPPVAKLPPLKGKKPVVVGSTCQPVQVYEQVPGTTYYRAVTHCQPAAH